MGKNNILANKKRNKKLKQILSVSLATVSKQPSNLRGIQYSVFPIHMTCQLQGGCGCPQAVAFAPRVFSFQDPIRRTDLMRHAILKAKGRSYRADRNLLCLLKLCSELEHYHFHTHSRTKTSPKAKADYGTGRHCRSFNHRQGNITDNLTGK